jgi:hypothetical protein
MLALNILLGITLLIEHVAFAHSTSGNRQGEHMLHA